MTSGAQTYSRLRMQLDGPFPAPVWPEGIRPAAFDAADPRQLHTLLDAAFPGGLIAGFADWYGNLTNDTEFDSALCVPALTGEGEVAGFVQCWTSGFVKDLAVAPRYRGQGLGAALMLHIFALFAARGLPHVDLKVQLVETTARRLYIRLGMVEVA